MSESRRTVSLAVTALALAVLAACGGDGNPGNVAQDARAEIKVLFPQELSASDVARVHVDVRGPGIPTPIGMDLSLQGGTWQGTLIDIPAGLERVFEATSFDASSTLLYKGQAGPISVASGSTVSVAILLQQVNLPATLHREHLDRGNVNARIGAREHATGRRKSSSSLVKLSFRRPEG